MPNSLPYTEGARTINDFREKVMRAWKAGGLREVTGRAVARGTFVLSNRYKSPLSRVRSISGTFTESPLLAVSCVAAQSELSLPSTMEFKEWRSEFFEIWHQTKAPSQGSFGKEFDLGKPSAETLYYLVRWLRPRRVVETGVARGVSTLLVLAAMDRNGLGELLSFDVNSSVGSLVPTNHPRWNLQLLSTSNLQSDLIQGLQEASPIDIFFHDSDHSFYQQSFEFSVARCHLGHQGLLLSDDVESSQAFLDFAASQHSRPIYVVDTQKMLGILVL